MFNIFFGRPNATPGFFSRGAAKFFLALALFFLLLGVFVIVFPKILAIFVAAVFFLLALLCLSLAWRNFRASRPPRTAGESDARITVAPPSISSGQDSTIII